MKDLEFRQTKSTQIEIPIDKEKQTPIKPMLTHQNIGNKRTSQIASSELELILKIWNEHNSFIY